MNETLNLIKKTILSNKNLVKEYKLIGFFGSCLNSDKFFDIDLISIGKNKTHYLLKSKIKKDLSESGLKAIFFDTYLKEPISKKDREILIHDLHYSSLKDLYKREWKDIINEIKRSCKTIYGSKKDIKKVKSSTKDFNKLLLNISRKISKENDYLNFKKDLLKNKARNIGRHPELKTGYLKILGILNRNKNWSMANKKIISILNKEIKEESYKKL